MSFCSQIRKSTLDAFEFKIFSIFTRSMDVVYRAEIHITDKRKGLKQTFLSYSNNYYETNVFLTPISFKLSRTSNIIKQYYQSRRFAGYFNDLLKAKK